MCEEGDEETEIETETDHESVVLETVGRGDFN